MTSELATALTITLPDWVDETVRNWDAPLVTDSERMRLAVALSAKNIECGGGPFAALVFAGEQWLGAGVNRVVDSGFSIAHAEILALMTAQRRRRDGSALDGDGRDGDRTRSGGGPLTLVTTTEPCCQCFGALIWAGVARLVCGATTADAEAVGFDEGPKPEDWVAALEQRGLSVVLGVEAGSARAVLMRYAEQGGEIYGREKGEGR
jgi:tRNA(Arg) A34 adenosine deaminase TadA